MSEQRTNSQALCDATLFWWEHRKGPRQPYEPGTLVGYIPLESRSPILRKLAGRAGHVMQTLTLEQRLIQFGGEEDGTVIVATLEELWPL